MHTLLALCSIFALIVLISVSVTILRALWKNRKRGTSGISLKEIIFGKEPRLGSVLLGFTIFAIGVSNLVASHFFASAELGSFYEQSTFCEYYDAMLTVDDKSFFCIAELDKYTDPNPEFGTSYRIFSLHLPYGKIADTDEYYYPESEKNSIALGENGTRCNIKLYSLATDDSYVLLENTIVSNYGEFCGSKSSDSFHFTDCPQVKNISRENLVYFSTDAEADVLGYTICKNCKDRW